MRLLVVSLVVAVLAIPALTTGGITDGVDPWELQMSLADDTGDNPKLQIKGVATTFQFVDSASDTTTGE